MGSSCLCVQVPGAGPGGPGEEHGRHGSVQVHPAHPHHPRLPPGHQGHFSIVPNKRRHTNNHDMSRVEDFPFNSFPFKP